MKGVRVRTIRGAWYVVLTVKGRRRAERVEDEAAARAVCTMYEFALRDGRLDVLFPAAAAEELTFGEVADTWLGVHGETNLGTNTLKFYRTMLAHVPAALQERTLSAITRPDIKDLVAACLAKGLSRGTVMGVLRTISALYGQALEDGLYHGANPAAKPSRILKADTGDLPDDVDDAGSKHLDPVEGNALLEAARIHDQGLYPLLLVALRTGARQGELLALKWAGIDLDADELVIKGTIVDGRLGNTKGRRRRPVLLTSEVRTALRTHKARLEESVLAAGERLCPWVFPSPTGIPADPSLIRRRFKMLLKRAGLRAVPFHSLHGTALSWMAARGVQPLELQRIAGHQDYATTEKFYLDPTKDSRRNTLGLLEAAS